MTILGLLTIITSPAYAHQPKPPADRSLQSLERYNVKRLKHATQVIRFFERHPRILNARKTRRKAWRIVHHHQRIIRQATARLIVLRQRMSPGPLEAIRLVFGPYADQAIRVADCETGGTFSVYARNGQYLGLFQMGDYARGRYGHSWTPLGQARAAYRYFVDAGRDWSPWECQP